jgi:hypothetical protein
MDFREIGKLVSEDRFSLEYLWKKRGNTLCPSCSSSDFYYHGFELVRDYTLSHPRSGFVVVRIEGYQIFSPV